MPKSEEKFHNVPDVDYPGKAVTLIRKGSKAGQKFADETTKGERRNQYSGHGSKIERKVAKAMAAEDVVAGAVDEENDRRWERHKRSPNSPFSFARKP